MRELRPTTYNATQYTDENLLYRSDLIDPVELKQGLTYMYGKDSDMFPLTTMTEGNGAFKSVKPKLLNDTQYVWKVMGRMKHTSNVVRLYDSSNTAPGLGQSEFQVVMEDNTFHAMYSAFTPDQQNQIRIQTEGRQIGTNEWLYTFSLMTGTIDTYISLDNFLSGLAWVMGATSVAASKSDGTTSNSMLPGEWTNQFGFHRYSKQIAGNISNKVTNIEFDLEDGSKTTKWMPFEMGLWEQEMRLLNESDLWYSEYNRDENGVIHLKDPETGEPIPKGAGVKQILSAVNNYDTYAILTRSKLDNTVKAVFSNRVDKTPMEIVLYTGRGGAEMFHRAIMTDAVNNNYYTALGEKNISGGTYLSYGAYFNQYRTIDNRLITIRIVDLFDHGLLAEQQRANGQMYEGYPWESYNLVFLDHSMTSDGDRNIQLVAEEGREYITGVYKGMSPLPGAWGGIPKDFLSTRKDIAAYEVMTSQGIAFTNPTTSFWLQFRLD